MVSIDSNNLKTWQDNDLEKMRYDYALNSTDHVLDIGSYRREFADEIIKRYGCTVECFDALDNKAAWLFDGIITAGGQYYYTSAFDKTGPQNEYRCVDIAPFIYKEVALCKINIEGGEYQLLDYIIKRGLVHSLKNIQVQFHLIEGMDCESLYQQLAVRLSKTHSITWRTPFVWENWKRNA
jgi:hypothetical protein